MASRKTTPLRLARDRLGVEELGGSSGSGVTKGSNSSTSGGGLVSYSTSGRAISLDRQTYDSYISSHGGDRATANSRVEAAVTPRLLPASRTKTRWRPAWVRPAQQASGPPIGQRAARPRMLIMPPKRRPPSSRKPSRPRPPAHPARVSGSQCQHCAFRSDPPVVAPPAAARPVRAAAAPAPIAPHLQVHLAVAHPAAGSGKGHPVLLDLDGDGFDVTRLDQSSVYFDIGGDGYKHRTAWLEPVTAC